MEIRKNPVETILDGLEIFLHQGKDLNSLLDLVLQQKNEKANFPSTLEAWHEFLAKHKDSDDPRFSRDILAQLELKLNNALNPKPKRRR